MSDLNGKTIAVLEGSVQQEVLHRIREQFSLTFNEIALSKIEQIIDLIKSGKADAMLSSRFFVYKRCKGEILIANPLVLNPTALHFVTASNRYTEMLHTIDKHLANMLYDPGSLSPKQQYCGSGKYAS